MATNPNWAAAIVFYALYVVGILAFVVCPGRGESLTYVAMMGVLHGFIAYATFDLTSMAALRDWPLPITVIDMIWAAVLTATVATASRLMLERLSL